MTITAVLKGYALKHDTKIAPTMVHNLPLNNAVVLAPDLCMALENEIAHRCRGKVTKRLALKLALSVISENRDGMFLAEKLVDEIRPRVKHEAALREIYLERQAKEGGR